MIERDLDLPTADGAMNTFVVHPDEGGPFPVVLFYMDAPGKREELHDMARRIGSGRLLRRPAEPLLPPQPRLLAARARPRKASPRCSRTCTRSTAARSSATREAMLRFVDGEPKADRERASARSATA